jgi:hypothetical protein
VNIVLPVAFATATAAASGQSAAGPGAWHKLQDGGEYVALNDFVFSRRPYCMHDFNAKLVALPLGITTAMHVEGGPEASLSIHGGGIDLDLNGSYETSFNENDDEQKPWPIPNVLGVARR